MLTVEAAAKINLSLEVYGKRFDGFHDLRSVVLPITLSDTLSFDETADEISSDSGYGEKDLICRAACALRAAMGIARGVRVTVTKRIPVGGGLGGGSADAAATLLALNALWNCGLDIDRLAAIGASVGSDVPALLLAQATGHAVLMEGRGERVSTIPSPSGWGPDTPIVLVRPDVSVSTPEAYAAVRPRPGMPQGEPALMGNDLQSPACAKYPEIASALEFLRQSGATAVAMSGSGSVVFGRAPTEASAVEIVQCATASGYEGWVVHPRLGSHA